MYAVSIRCIRTVPVIFAATGADFARDRTGINGRKVQWSRKERTVVMVV